MNILLIEDEITAAKKLISILEKIDKEIHVSEICNAVSSSVNWLKNHPQPDLIFMDIQLTDGISFEIFKQIEINCPIIFVTAFDNFALEAFRVNSVDYILKPYEIEHVKLALQKYDSYFQHTDKSIDSDIYFQLSKLIKPQYKKRFFTKLNHSAYTILTDDIQYFVFEDNATLLINASNKKFVINYSLDALENLLDPNKFFRINRQFIISLSCITKMDISMKNRIDVFFGRDKHELVSRQKTKSFKDWLDQ